MNEVAANSKFWDEVTYLAPDSTFRWVGNVVAKQLPLEANGFVAGYLVAFPKPVQAKGEDEDSFQRRLSEFARVFRCNPETLGPCVNRIISETELIFNEPD